MTGAVISHYETAIKIFESISGWKDADELKYACQKRIKEIKAKEELDRLEKERQKELVRIKAERYKKLIIKITSISSAALCVIIAAAIFINTVILPPIKYNKASALFEAGKEKEAILILCEIPKYKDSYKLVKDYYDKIKVNVDKISAGIKHTVSLKADGTVVAVGRNSYGQCNVSSWTDIVAIFAGTVHTVGLKADGTVVAVGNNHNGQCGVSGWRDIIAVSAGSDYSVGLKSDGTVVAVGGNDEGQCDVSGWDLF